VARAAQKKNQRESPRAHGPYQLVTLVLANIDTESARTFHASSLFGHLLPTILKIVT
jgi:hypothetical protein